MPADFNGDGRTDLVHRWSGGLNVWISNGDGSLTQFYQGAQAGYGWTDGVWLVADTNGDGKSDLVHRWSGGLNIWTSNGNATLTQHFQGAQTGYGWGDGQWLSPIYSINLISHQFAKAQPNEPALKCRVPHLRKLTLAEAKRKLKRAHCTLGKVHRRRRAHHHGKLLVTHQSTRAGNHRDAGFRVNISLG
jgi:hypothetical protein